jgi:hypothetical protein
VTRLWFFARLVPALCHAISEALHEHLFFGDTTAEEQAEVRQLFGLLEQARALSLRLGSRAASAYGPAVDEASVRCMCGHTRAAHELASSHACFAAIRVSDLVQTVRCACRSFTPAEPLYEPKEAPTRP